MSEKEKNYEGYGDIDAFFSRLFEVRDVLHFTHLKQEDYKLSTHIALEEAYTAMLPLIDGLVEGYTGLYYAPNIMTSEIKATKTPLEFAQKFYKTLKEGRNLFVDSWIHNEIDELLKITAMLIYKLKYVR